MAYRIIGFDWSEIFFIRLGRNLRRVLKNLKKKLFQIIVFHPFGPQNLYIYLVFLTEFAAVR